MIELKEITRENLEKVLTLKVKKEQESFVALNAKSIAQSKFYPSLVTLIVYNENEPVGFLMFGENETDGCMWIIRMMIDEKFQRKGYGREALRQLIELIKKEYGCQEIFLSFDPENEAAKKLYESFGFYDTGKIEEGEIVYKLNLK
ncbi:MAG: GNAT family N-acetyltransferase [Chlorobi bacterium]|nr:GNAT family N-acetyltransferase [Chlorobiota bacterium]